MNQIGQFILTYFTDIVIVIILFIIILFYFIVKRKNQDNKHNSFKEKINNNENNALKKEEDNYFQYTIIPKKRIFNESFEITKKSFEIFNGLKIIIADDNKINQKVLTGLLANSGIDIKLADNGQEVLDILDEEDNVSIILMDVRMPIMDGLEASKIIKNNKKFDNILIVALSGDIAIDDIKKMNQAGMQENLKKPLRLYDLFKVLYSYTDKQITIIKEEKSSCLNIHDGVEICGGDKKLYKDILHDFTALYKDINKRLYNNLVKNDLKDSLYILLDISGLAASIGANKLAKITTQYREIIINNYKSKYNKAHINFTNEINKVFNEIKLEL